MDFQTGIILNKEYWDDLQQRVLPLNSNAALATDLNDQLSQMQADMIAVFREYELRNVMPSISELRNSYNKQVASHSPTREQNDDKSGTLNVQQVDKKEPKTKKKGLWAYFDEFVKVNGKLNDWTDATHEKFAALRNHLFGFDPKLTFEKFDEMVDAFTEIRKGKIDRDEAEFILRRDLNYFGVMLVKLGYADGLVSGAIHTTADTIRPALQIIRTIPGRKRVSGVMVMLGPDGEQLVFADTAVNITLEADELAEVAVETAHTAKTFGLDPYVAMLSFSTHGSAHHDLATKVARATSIAKEINPEMKIVGEIQFDAAIDPETAKNKAPESDVAGKCNVFIFPDLQAGNIGYKIAQRLGGYKALGPILQGLNAPVNDLSRGCSAQDVYEIAIITAMQAAERAREAAEAADNK